MPEPLGQPSHAQRNPGNHRQAGIGIKHIPDGMGLTHGGHRSSLPNTLVHVFAQRDVLNAGSVVLLSEHLIEGSGTQHVWTRPPSQALRQQTHTVSSRTRLIEHCTHQKEIDTPANSHRIPPMATVGLSYQVNL